METRSTVANLLVSLRPDQWTKNLFVFAALIFAVRLFDPAALALATAAFLIFCALSGAVYLVNAGNKQLLLNLDSVPYIDSAGLGEIVRSYTTVSRQGGKLKLLNLTKRIEDLLSITKLLTVFDVYENEAEAVQSFSA